MFSRYNEYNVFNASGVFRFNGKYTGFDQADYILGLMNQFKQGNGEIEFRRRHYQALYFGDAFRVTPRLTLNLGVRWEPYTPMTDLNNRSDQFIQEMYSQGIHSPHFVKAPPGLFYPGDKLPNGYRIPKAGTEGDMKNLSPRIGFAWDVTGSYKTIVRGGFGVTFDRYQSGITGFGATNPPFVLNPTLSNGYLQDITSGRGVVVIDPKGDLVADVADRIPGHHVDPVRRIVGEGGDPPLGVKVVRVLRRVLG